MLRTLLGVLGALALLAGAAPTLAANEILTCTMDRVEVIDWASGNMERRETPVVTAGPEKKPLSHTLVIAGLGTNRVTAKMPNWALALGTQVFPMNRQGDSPVGEDEVDWFYVRHNQGVAVIEIPRRGRPFVTVRFHSLGAVPYTYVGKCR